MGLRKVTCVLLLCCSTAGLASATPKETHKRGVEAIEAGRWEDAARFFQEAIAEKPEEKVRLIGADYLPHYYLGVALSELGRCRSALDALKESERQAQVQKSDHAADLTRRRTRCQDHLRRVTAAKQAVEQILTEAGEAAAALKNLSHAPELAPLWDQGSPSYGSRQRGAEMGLAKARERFAAGGEGGEIARLDEAKSLAETALAELKATRADARRRLGELNAAIAAALEQLEVVEDGARKLLRSVADLAPYPRRLGSRVAAVDQILKQIAETESAANPQQLSEMAGELTDAMAALRRASRRPPRELSQAVEAYLNGSYEDALALVDDDHLKRSAQARPYVCLIQAASHHGLWVLGGERDDAARDLAVEAINGCAESTPDEEPPSLPLSSKIFSPRFVDFYNAAVQADLPPMELEGDDGGPEPPVAEPAGASPESAGARPEPTETSENTATGTDSPGS